MIRCELEYISKGQCKVYFRSDYIDAYVGDFVLDVDGYFYFFSKEDTRGGWVSWQLRMLSEKLDELNKPWDDQINEYFKGDEGQVTQIPPDVDNEVNLDF